MPIRNQLVLQENHPRALDGTGGAELRAVSGIVWITETGAADDVFLRAGESHQLRRKGRVVVEAVRGEARIELFRPGWQGWQGLVELVRRTLRSATAIPTPAALAVLPAPTVRQPWIGAYASADPASGLPSPADQRS